jgi:hypothetical protein
MFLFSLELEQKQNRLNRERMSNLSSERSKTWDVYTASNPGPSHSQTGGVGGVDEEGPWKSFGTSMSAISFGFVATAILISMFLIMAIFEHLFKPTQQFSSTPESMLLSYQEQHSLPTTKQGNAQSVSPIYHHNRLHVLTYV